MIFQKIKVCNYGPYYKDHIINIPENGKKIVIIKGENGAGKTNFINALVWCLYNTGIKPKSTFNDRALSELINLSDKDQMYVEIHFNYNDKKHIINRKIIAKKTNFGYDFEQAKTTLEIFNENAKSTNFLEDIEIENYINNILNESVKNYFFFDGAKIETFTKEDHNKDVENAIKNLLKIETIKRACEHIDAIKMEIMNSIKLIEANNKELENIDEIIKTLNKEKKDVLALKDTSNNNLSALNKNMTTIDKEIQNIIEQSKHKEHFNLIEEQQKSFKLSLDDSEKKINLHLEKSFLCFSDKLIEDSITILNNKNKENTIPASILREIIKRSLDKCKCFICDEALHENKKNILERKLPEIIIEKETILNYYNTIEHLKEIKNHGKNLYGSIMVHKKQYNDYKEQIEKLNEKLKNYDNKIAEELPDIEEYKKLQSSHKDQRDDLLIKIGEIEEKIKHLDKSIKEYNNEFNQLSKKSEKSTAEQHKLNVTLKIQEELERIFSEYEKHEIKKINYEIKEIFNLIIRKKDVFTEIFVDPNYMINVNRSFNNDNIINQLSYGERQILSLALILSLAKVSGDIGPFIMDTPMGNLDPIHRRKLILNLPKLVNQVFLLVTSSEFTKDLHDICHDDISVKYVLNTTENGMTQVNEEI